LQGWIGSLAPHLTDLIARDAYLGQHAYFLRDTARQSKYLMSEELEALAAELCLDAGAAFTKLQGNVTSQLKVPFERGGKTESLPITVVHNLCFDPDGEVRRRAYDAEVAGWESIARPWLPASMREGDRSYAQPASRPAQRAGYRTRSESDRSSHARGLAGSHSRVVSRVRRYLKSKASKLGHEQLPWWDLFAPLGAAHNTFTWRQARDFIVSQFGTFSPELGDFAAQVFDRRWIDGEPRDGKRGGAYCMGLMRLEESRILAKLRWQLRAGEHAGTRAGARFS